MRKRTLTPADCWWSFATDLWFIREGFIIMFNKLATILRLKKRKIKRVAKMPPGCTIVPRDYQLEGVARIDYHGGRALLADQMGLGKTATAAMYIMLKGFSQVVVVCYATIKYNWEKELSKMGIRADVLEGEQPMKMGIIKPARVLIINYDILWAWVDYLRSLNPQLIIADEVQAVKNMNTKRYKALAKLCKGVPHLLPMSGTPIENNVIEFFPVLNLLWPKQFPSLLPFALKFCPPTKTHGRVVFGAGVELKLLNHRLKRLGMIRRLKKDVLTELAPKTRTVVPLQLSEQAMTKYRTAIADFRSWLRKARVDRDASMRSEALNHIGFMLRLVAELKLPLVIDWVEQFLESGNKLILFALHNNKPPIINTLAEKFSDRCVVVNGTVTGKNRQKHIDKFNNDPSCTLFLGQLRAACAGWSCTSAADVVHIELWWHPGPHIQGEDRPHGLGRGMGKDVPCNSTFLIARGTIEERLAIMLQNKAEQLDLCLDGKTGITQMNLYSMLLDQIMEENK